MVIQQCLEQAPLVRSSQGCCHTTEFKQLHHVPPYIPAECVALEAQPRCKDGFQVLPPFISSVSWLIPESSLFFDSLLVIHYNTSTVGNARGGIVAFS